MVGHKAMMVTAATMALLASPGRAMAPPAYLPAFDDWQATDSAPRPGLNLEMLTALGVAQRQCSGRHGALIRRYLPIMINARRDWFHTDGFQAGWHYRRAHGARWKAVLSDQIASMRQRYENHPDPARFCRLAAIVAREGSGEFGGTDLRRLFADMIRYMTPPA